MSKNSITTIQEPSTVMTGTIGGIFTTPATSREDIISRWKTADRISNIMRGKIIFDADLLARQNKDFGLGSLYKELGIGKMSATRFRAYYERWTAGKLVLQGASGGSGIIDTKQIMLEDISKNNNNLPPQGDLQENLNEETPLTGEEKRVIEQWTEAMTTPPDYGRVIDNHAAYSKKRDQKTGNKEYSLLQEAYLYDEAMIYYDDKKMSPKKFGYYLDLTVEAAKYLEVEPYEIAPENIEDYIEHLNEEEANEVDDEAIEAEVKEPTFNPTILDKLTPALLSNIAYWRVTTNENSGYVLDERTPTEIMSSIFNDAEKESATWKKNRKDMMRAFHPDLGGDKDSFRMITLLDNMFNEVDSMKKSELNLGILRAEENTIKKMPMGEFSAIYEEYMEYQSAKEEK